jgi:pimeloyl-ACP methyl ester carboxylesterase
VTLLDPVDSADRPERTGAERGGPTPPWREPSALRSVDVGDVRVAYRVWEPGESSEPAPGSSTVLLVHGNAARSEWWDPIAPRLGNQVKVVAVDLSGHGRSTWRSSYDYGSWAQEVLAVLDAEKAKSQVTVVGHSMGGLVALSAAWAEPRWFRGVILLDTPLRRFTDEQLAKRAAIAARPLPRYPSLEQATSQFRTTPTLIRRRDEIIDHVARHSYRPGPDGWVLHFDPTLYSRVTHVDDFLRPFPPNTHLVRAEHGLLTDGMVEEMQQHLTVTGSVTMASGVGHNLILETPEDTARLVHELAGLQ